MLPFRSIKSLYRLAFAEGEGIGTAYEYFAKRLVLSKWLDGHARAKRVLIAGLPQKYGSSLDFLLIAQELGAAEIFVADDRPGALEKARQGLAAAQAMGELSGLKPQFVLCTDLGFVPELIPSFDLFLSSELLQTQRYAAAPHHDHTLVNVRRTYAMVQTEAQYH